MNVRGVPPKPSTVGSSPFRWTRALTIRSRSMWVGGHVERNRHETRQHDRPAGAAIVVKRHGSWQLSIAWDATRTGRLRVVLVLNLLLVGALVAVRLSAHSLGVLVEGVDYIADAAAIAVSLLAI